MNPISFKTRFFNFFSSIDPKNFIFLVSIGIIGQIVLLTLGFIFKFNSVEQLSLEYLFVFTFLFTMITAGMRHGYPVILLFMIELLIVINEETNSLYNLKTYMYTGFNINLGYQEALPGNALSAGGYPIAIAFAWVFLIYGCYNFTNFLLDGAEKTPDIRLRGIPARIFLDGMFLWQFSLLVEAVGIDLGYWEYNQFIIDLKNQPTFFNAPMDTLYYYLITAILFNSILRFGLYFYHRKRRKETNLNWFNGFAPIMFLYFWMYLLFIVLINFGLYHWAFFIGTPSFFIFLLIFVIRFIKPKLNEIHTNSVNQTKI